MATKKKKIAATNKKSVKARPAKAKKVAMKKAPAKKVVKKVAAKAVKKTVIKLVPKKIGPVPPKNPVIVAPKNKSSLQYSQNELFESIMGSCGFGSKKEAKEFYGQFAGMIQAALKSGYKLMLPGLGKIQVRKTKPRMGRNPMTQEIIKIPARRKVAFTATKALKQAVL